LAAKLGYPKAPKPEVAASQFPFDLSDIYDAEIEALISDVYQRDYMMFGFKAWQ